MQRIIEWYWNYGIKRGTDINDPDRELRKISIGSWLDPLVRIIDRNQAILGNSSQKACLALWGPSQTGKSTMISGYVDGVLNDGSDSALTWNLQNKVRFSPPKEGMGILESQFPDTLVFNPYNHQSDASGVATRYTLKSSESKEVNIEYPIELILTVRSQIMQSLALGYLSECECDGEDFIYTQKDFMELLPSDQTEASSSPEAYLILKDLANVIEFMRGNRRFYNLFKDDSWDKKIRPALVSNAVLLSNSLRAEEFMAKILWDSASKLTSFYKTTETLLQLLGREWAGAKILASMEVGALILDIDSYNSYCNPDSPHGLKVKEKVSCLSYEKKNNEVYIFLGSGNGSCQISGDNFGYFQAICAELVVPLNKEKLEVLSNKSSFLKLIKRCDFLDFPGVSNKNTGASIGNGNAALIQLSNASNADLVTKVFKQGKTQCFVYNYVKKYGIDAFSILVRTDRYPSQSSLLNSGISEWISSYKSPDCEKNEMPIFVNMTFFSSLLNSVSQSGIGNGLAPYIDRIQKELLFTQKNNTKFFPTTYQQFHGGKIENISNKDDTIRSILNDRVFVEATGFTHENLEAVYSNDGGLGYMFNSIEELMIYSKRKEKCNSILRKDEFSFSKIIESQLPSSSESSIEDRKKTLRECIDRISQVLSIIEEDGDEKMLCGLANELKRMFSSVTEDFDILPLNMGIKGKKDVRDYIKRQIGKWSNTRLADLGRSQFFSEEQEKAIICSLRDSIDINIIYDILSNQFGEIDDNRQAKLARYLFSIIFSNILKTGKVILESSSKVGDHNPPLLEQFIEAARDRDINRNRCTYCRMIINPAIERLSLLSEISVYGERPPQEGDAELVTIYNDIRRMNKFQIK